MMMALVLTHYQAFQMTILVMKESIAGHKAHIVLVKNHVTHQKNHVDVKPNLNLVNAEVLAAMNVIAVVKSTLWVTRWWRSLLKSMNLIMM